MTLRSALVDLLAQQAELRAVIVDKRHPEFEVAIRRSQIVRVRTLLLLAPIFLALIVLRFLVLRQPEGFPQILSIVVTLALYEFLVYTAAVRAERDDRSLPMWFWRLNAVLESFFPTFAILLLSHSEVVPGYRAIVLPLVFLYFTFIILSILSLRPSLPLICGFVSAAGYAYAIYHTHTFFDGPPDDPLPISFLVLAIPNLIVTGAVAAWVAVRIRHYALAEIKETAERQTMEHELFVAGRIQGGLLPVSPPEMGAFRLAGWNRPAVHAGGDYYDWVSLPDGRVAVALADVSGHGLGPAVLAVLCRSYLRAALTQYTSLAEALSVVNNLVREDLPDGWFITMAVAVIPHAAGDIELLSAGHGPMLKYNAATGVVDTLSADAPPLGVLEDFKVAQAQRIHLEPGDVLGFITDGFHEWPADDGSRFGLDRLRASLATHAGGEPKQIISGMLNDVKEFAGNSRQTDDLTALVVKRG